MRILLVDDHSIFREGLRHVLKELGPDIAVLQAKSCEEALSIVSQQHRQLDLVLLDLAMPGESGLVCLREIRGRYPIVPVVVVSASEECDDVKYALQYGAMGFIPKASSNEMFLCALRLILSGGTYFPPKSIAEPVSSPHGKDGAQDASAIGHPPTERRSSGFRLTDRQMDVLALLVQSKSNKLIGRELDLSEKTVKAHVSAIFRALNVSTRAEAARVVAERGIKLSRKSDASASAE